MAVTAALWTGVRAWMVGAALYLPKEWLTPDARQRGRIPTTVHFQEKWRLALTLLRRIRAASFGITAVLGDAEFGNNATLRRTLHRLHLPYALGICVDPDGLSRHPDGGRAAPKPGRRRPPSHLQIADRQSTPRPYALIAAALPAKAWRRVTWRNGTNRPWAAHCAAVRVTPAHDWRTRRLTPRCGCSSNATWAPPRGSRPTSSHLPATASLPVAGALGPSPLGDRTTVSGAEGRARARPLRGTLVCRLASPCRADRTGLCVAAGRTPACRGTRADAASLGR